LAGGVVRYSKIVNEFQMFNDKCLIIYIVEQGTFISKKIKIVYSELSKCLLRIE